MVVAKKVPTAPPAKKAVAKAAKRAPASAGLPKSTTTSPAPVPAAAVPAATAGEKAAKAKKPKLMRDSFTIPKLEYEVLGQLKQRSAKLGQAAKKSELLRAGIMALAALPDAAFTSALTAVPAIKTGRPART